MNEYDTYTNTQTGKPFKSYRKTIQGKVAVYVFNSITNQPGALILEGKDNLSADATIDTWTPVEDAYFRRMNRRHLETGHLIEFVRAENYEEIKTEYMANATDDEIIATFAYPWLKFKKSVLTSITSEAVAIRFLTLAKQAEKSESYLKALEAKIAELQGAGIVEEE